MTTKKKKQRRRKNKNGLNKNTNSKPKNNKYCKKQHGNLTPNDSKSRKGNEFAIDHDGDDVEDDVDVCFVCADPEDLDMIQCDNIQCGKHFHVECVNMISKPLTQLYCNYCQRTTQ